MLQEQIAQFSPLFETCLVEDANGDADFELY